MTRFVLLILLCTGYTAVTQTTAVFAQTSGITSPAPGAVLSGQVTVTGTAVHPDFLRYELAFLNQSAGATEWVVFASGANQVTDGVLAVWDTTAGRESGAPVFPDGRYQLRLRVVKTDYNYDEYFVTGLIISNDGPTPTPTPDETAAAATGAAVSPPAQGTPEENGLVPATPIPSLTPFPTPTPPATPLPPPPESVPAAGETTGGQTGLAAQLEKADPGRIIRAFWTGVKISFGIFALFALYLILRALFRWLWRLIWVKKVRGD